MPEGIEERDGPLSMDCPRINLGTSTSERDRVVPPGSVCPGSRVKLHMGPRAARRTGLRLEAIRWSGFGVPDGAIAPLIRRGVRVSPYSPYARRCFGGELPSTAATIWK